MTGREALAALAGALRDAAGEPLAEDAYADWARDFRDGCCGCGRVPWSGRPSSRWTAVRPQQGSRTPAPRSEAEPLREVAVLTLVRALAAAGDPAAALARYDQYRRALADELGLDPSSAAAELHQLVVERGAVAAGDRPTQRRPAPCVHRPSLRRPRRRDCGRAGGSTAQGAARSWWPGGPGAASPGWSRKSPSACRRSSARAVAPERTEPRSLARGLLRDVLAQDITYREGLPPRLATALAMLLPELGSTVDGNTDPESLRALIQEATIRVLAAVDQVLVVDDVQWADPTSLGMLETARARLPGLRLVLAFRPEEILEGSAADALLGRAAADVRVHLGGLPRAALGDLVVDEDLADALGECTDRTPLAVAEVLRALAGEGLVARDAMDRWRCLGPRAPSSGPLGWVSTGSGRPSACAADRQPPPVRLVLDLVCLLAREVPALTLAVACAAGEAEVAGPARRPVPCRTGAARVKLGWASSHDMVGEALSARMDERTAGAAARHARPGAGGGRGRSRRTCPALARGRRTRSGRDRLRRMPPGRRWTPSPTTRLRTCPTRRSHWPHHRRSRQPCARSARKRGPASATSRAPASTCVLRRPAGQVRTEPASWGGWRCSPPGPTISCGPRNWPNSRSSRRAPTGPHERRPWRSPPSWT